MWWLVSPQNPLKPTAGMAPLADRLAGAETMVGRSPRIKVTDLEARLGTRFTADTLRQLHRRFPAMRFVWLMGADNLQQIARWQRWTEIFRLAAVAVFDRPAYSLSALSGLAARRFARHRLLPAAARGLAEADRPAWAYFAIRLEPASATEIRQRRRRRVFARPSPQP